MTAKILFSVANYGGPRCCKRDSFLAIMGAVAFVEEQFTVVLPGGKNPQCEFSSLNKECLAAECPFYPRSY
jgi:hypothetical protein